MPGAGTSLKNESRRFPKKKNLDFMKQFAEDFPNPERKGCPSRRAIKLTAEEPLDAKEWVLDHIFLCWPCFQEHARFLQLRKAKLRAARRL